jgi:cobalamin biosynthetic protein CobC
MRHGGNLSEAQKQFGRPTADWLDLSTGINPIPYPFSSPDSFSWSRLPQADRESALIEAARRAYRVAPAAQIVSAPGTQILIQLAARLRPSARVEIVSPTYSEHRTAWEPAGGEVRNVPDLPEKTNADVVVVANPNNPDGRRWTPLRLSALRENLAARGGLLVVDEAFADINPSLSMAPHAGPPGLVVLRSFGKFYGLAGVRLGFAIGAAEDISRLTAWLGPWAVSGPAIEIGIEALSDGPWADATRARLSALSGQLDRILRANGLSVIGNAGLFILAEHPRARAIYEELARVGILVRVFEYAPTWLRFGLPEPTQFERLETALAEAVRRVA